MSEIVFAFDRDWTVDVNPHPEHEAVPLEWVQHLAHETDHPVYAIGNQTLVEEASIPGVETIVERHDDAWDEWLGERNSYGRYEQYPARRERLRLVQDLHPDAHRYVVVDDIDLSDVTGWDHYFAWDFVPAVERGDIDRALPWVEEPVTDGGLPTRAGIMPSDPGSFKSFLEEYGSGYSYKLDYVEDGTEQSALLHDVSMVKISLERPAAAPTVSCTPADPSAEKFRVTFEDIEMLHVVDLQPEQYVDGAETPAEEATGWRRLAETDPHAVNVSAILTLLDTGDEDVLRNREALRALRRVAAVRPEDCTPAVPILRSLLAKDDPIAPAQALGTLAAVGEEDAADIAPAAEDIIPYLDSEIVGARREAARAIAEVADEYPEDAVHAVPGLATIIEDDADGERFALFALSAITRELPDVVKPMAGTLSGVITDDSNPSGMRLNATAALGRTIGEFPDVGVEIVDDMVELLDTEEAKLRNNAIALLGDVAKTHADVIEPYVGEIEPLLTADDRYTRINASAALSRVAEDFPESVDHLTRTFIDLLEDDGSLVRTNACWTLGYLEAGEAKEALAERAHDDENEQVRSRAAWAHARIER